MKKTLNQLVREEAVASVVANQLHHNICKQLVALADENNFPMGVLVYIAIGTSAHKPMIFANGYKKIDVAKAKAVMKMCKIFAHKYGDKYYTNDKVVHTMSRYYEVGGSNNRLRKIVGASDIKFAETKIDTAKKLMGILFEKDANFSDKGYILGIK